MSHEVHPAGSFEELLAIGAVLDAARCRPSASLCEERGAEWKRGFWSEALRAPT